MTDPIRGAALLAERPPDRGTVCRMPPSIVAKDAPVPHTAEPTPPNPARRRVLVVEDNRDAADSMGMLIQLLGHDCHVCYNATAGLAAARSDRPDVLLCDLEMPGGMSGFDLASHLRGELPNALFVAVTGYGRDEDVKRAMAAGFDRHLTKPADPDDLLAALCARR